MNAALPPARAFVYIVIVLANVGVHFLHPDSAGGSLPDLIRWGANIAPLTLTGEPWRLVTSMFLHAGLLHLALNMYMLVAFGGVVERAFGAIRFTIVYLVSGLFGGLLSALWYAHRTLAHAMPVNGDAVTQEQLPLVVSVGASGALMGIAGASLAYWFVANRGQADAEALHMRRAMVQTIGLTLVMGFLLPVVDNAAHIGGLLAGMILGALFSLAGRIDKAIGRLLANALVAAASMLVLAALLSAPPPPGMLQLKAELRAEINRGNSLRPAR